MSEPSTIDDLLDRADEARNAGRGEVAACLYDEAIDRCRGGDDLEPWIRAALGAASVFVFGTEPGRLPALLHDLLMRTTDDADRARVAAALARCWVYAGQAVRGASFADEAVERAEQLATPGLLADCLDAALAVRWGPDQLNVRIELAARLDEVAAHVLDPDTRLQAHMWGLQVACETLDVQAIHRHMRALERLGEESPRALFFAASRRLMLDLLRGRTDTAEQLIAIAVGASEGAALPDAWMVVEALKGYVAVQSGDAAVCAMVASECEAFGLAEGAVAVCAEAAFLWLGAGDLGRARQLVCTFHGPVLDELPRDVNWLLTLQCILEAALAVDDREVLDKAVRYLAPYGNRAVFNAGAVMFHGLTDDTLARAAAGRGDLDLAARLRDRALATYERIGASWWHDRLQAWAPRSAPEPSGRQRTMRLHPATDGLWVVGAGPDAVPVRPLRGYVYLRELVRRPGQAVSALDLVAGSRGGVAQPGLGDALDRRALVAYRTRLRSLDEELSEAEDWSDSGRVEILRTERDALLNELSVATGLGGRARTSGSSHERARVAATKAINTAIERITTVDGSLGRHLRTGIHTGTMCSYRPQGDDDLVWIVDA